MVSLLLELNPLEDCTITNPGKKIAEPDTSNPEHRNYNHIITNFHNILD